MCWGREFRLLRANIDANGFAAQQHRSQDAVTIAGDDTQCEATILQLLLHVHGIGAPLFWREDGKRSLPEIG